MELKITFGEKTKTERFKKHDQFAAELIYFSKCVLTNQQPQPSALEGLSDLLVIEAIEQSLKQKKTVRVEKYQEPSKRPTLKQRQMILPAISKSQITKVHVTSP